MFNYVAAEWYKFRRRKGVFLALGLLMALETVVFLPEFFYGVGIEWESYAGILEINLVLGFFLAPIFAVRAFDDQYSRGTLKNEVVFGIPRRRAYLGKLLTAALVGTASAAIVVGWYLLLAVICRGIDPLYLSECVGMTLCAYPMWLATLSFSFLLLTAIRSMGGAIIATYHLLFVGMAIAAIDFRGEINLPIIYFINHYFFCAPFREMIAKVPGGGLEGLGAVALYSYGVSLAWIAATTAAGIALFRRREIK